MLDGQHHNTTDMSAEASTSNGNANGITEDEAALYDRQIRLWGVEAQNRMRSASVLIVTLRGLATEVCKNIVLAGIGRLTILDDKDITEEDLGCGFFFREEEVGTKRVDAARSRINALNPRVEVVASTDMQQLSEETALSRYDLVILSDSDAATISRTNDLCRKTNTKFYACGSYGLNGYIFADLLEHEWIIEKTENSADKNKDSSATEAVKVSVKKSQSFVPFSQATQHSFKSLSAKKQKKLSSMLFATLVLWEYQKQHNGSLPSIEADASQLKDLAKQILPKHDIDPNLLPDELIETLACTACTEFMPTCAILGGVMGQDALNTLGGREPPVINLFTLDGTSGMGDFHQLGLSS